MVTACSSSGVAPTSEARAVKRPGSACKSRWISYGRERTATTALARTRETLVFTPPMSQPITFKAMRLIGVIDLAGGRAVHARGGRRDAYAPVRSALLRPEEEG